MRLALLRFVPGLFRELRCERMPFGGQDSGLAHFSMDLAAEEIEQHTHALTARKELGDHGLKSTERTFDDRDGVTLANFALENRQLILVRLIPQIANGFLIQTSIALPETKD